MNIPRQCLPSPAQQSHTCGGNLARVTPTRGLSYSIPAAGFASFPSHGESGVDRCQPEDAKSLSSPSQYRTLKFVPCVVNEN